MRWKAWDIYYGACAHRGGWTAVGAAGGYAVPILRSWLGFKAEAKPHSSPVWAFIQNESCL